MEKHPEKKGTKKGENEIKRKMVHVSVFRLYTSQKTTEKQPTMDVKRTPRTDRERKGKVCEGGTKRGKRDESIRVSRRNSP